MLAFATPRRDSGQCGQNVRICEQRLNRAQSERMIVVDQPRPTKAFGLRFKECRLPSVGNLLRHCAVPGSLELTLSFQVDRGY